MRKTFKYRIHPTKKQTTALNGWLDECRWLYNELLAGRKTAYEQTGVGLGLYDQHGLLPELKKARPGLKFVHSQVLQNVAVRLDLAFKAFFRRVKAGETPGHPRFKGQGRYDSLTFPQYGNGCLLEGDRLKLSKIGHVRVVLHRPTEGTIKTCTVRRSSTGKWYATFSCEVERPEPLPESPEWVGIDVGLHTFATLSTGEEIDNPRFFRTEEQALAKVQRQLSKHEKGTPERKRKRKRVSRTHERIAWRRENFTHQHSRRIVNRFGLVAVEDLNVNRMVHEGCLSKSIADAAWSAFFQLLFVKAEWAGRTCVKVNPAFTTQDCHKCGHRKKMSLSERVFRCSCCGYDGGRDHNASINILRLGLQAVGMHGGA